MRFVLFIVLLAGIIGGTGYYYFFVFEPANYVAAILELKTELDEKEKILIKAGVDSRTDYDGAASVLEERKNFLKYAEERFLEIPLPYFNDEFVDFRENYLNSLSGYGLANEDAAAKAKFLSGFSDLGIIVNPEEKPPFDEKTAYVRDLQNYLEKALGSLKKVMNWTPAEEGPELNGEIDWKKLKSLWVGAEPAVDIMLNFMRMQTPNAKLAEYVPIGPVREQNEASEKTVEFGEALNKMLENNTAYDILAYRYFEDFDEKILKPKNSADEALEILRQKYGK